YGTGIRNVANLAAVTATVGGVNAQVSFAGPQGEFMGLDQLNILLPRTLAGRQDVDVTLSVAGRLANTVRISVK
ncbi:MAG: hypothetical protein ACKV2V_25775, partial [Blastocatellia bacterium]